MDRGTTTNELGNSKNLKKKKESKILNFLFFKMGTEYKNERADF
jgi:hypothetical protein